jgi:hypothetical protein
MGTSFWTTLVTVTGTRPAPSSLFEGEDALLAQPCHIKQDGRRQSAASSNQAEPWNDFPFVRVLIAADLLTAQFEGTVRHVRLQQ